MNLKEMTEWRIRHREYAAAHRAETDALIQAVLHSKSVWNLPEREPQHQLGCPEDPLLTDQLRLFLLECKDGYWYIGRTGESVLLAFSLHQAGQGGDWTLWHPPVRVAETIIGGRALEEAMVKHYRSKYGADRVHDDFFPRIDEAGPEPK